MKNKIKILYILRYISAMGGLQAVVMNYYRLIDKERFDIDFLVMTHEDADIEQQLQAEDVRIYTVRGIPERNLFLLVMESRRFFRDHHDYDIVHCHQTNFDSFFLFWAKYYKVPARMIHSHSISTDINWPQLVVEKYGVCRFSNWFLACSQDAGRFLFGDKIVANKRFTVVPNAFDLAKFAYDEERRTALRKQLNVDPETFLIGQVGRFSEEKRHTFTLKVMAELVKHRFPVRLCLVGNGPEYEAVKQKCLEMGLDAFVVFTGVRKDVPDLLQAFDLLIMPSVYEGVSVALLEALASGVSSVRTDTVYCPIPDDEGMQSVSLQAPAAEWADHIAELKPVGRIDRRESLKNAGYSIKEQAEVLMTYYEKIVRDSG